MTNQNQNSFIPFAGIFTSVLISMLGTTLTGFAMGLWVFEQTKSATLFALVNFAVLVPMVILAPVMGTWIDRHSRRFLMILGHSGAGLCTLLLAGLYLSESLEIWQVVIISGIGSIFNGLVYQTFLASKITLIPPHALEKMQGLNQGGLALVQILSPAFAGLLLSSQGIESIFAIDIISFTLAILLIGFFKIPRPLSQENEKTNQTRRSFGRDMRTGYLFLKSHHGLRSLLFLMAMMNFTFGIVYALLTPFIMSFAGKQELGVLLSTAGAGMLVGSLLLAWRGAPRSVAWSVVTMITVAGLVLLQAMWAFTLPQRLLLFGAGAFVIIVCYSTSQSFGTILWMKLVPPELQGRVFGFRGLVMRISYPLAFVAAGPLLDYVFIPLVNATPRLREISSDNTSGLAVSLVYMLIGAMLFLAARLIARRSAIYSLDRELAEIKASETRRNKNVKRPTSIGEKVPVSKIRSF